MSITFIAITCVIIIAVLIIFPLFISRKAEKDANPKRTEWDKIVEYGNKINKKDKS